MSSAAASDINLLTRQVKGLTKQVGLLTDLAALQSKRIDALEEQVALTAGQAAEVTAI